VSFTTTGNTSDASGLAVDRMPVAAANGSFNYYRTGIRLVAARPRAPRRSAPASPPARASWSCTASTTTATASTTWRRRRLRAQPGRPGRGDRPGRLRRAQVAAHRTGPGAPAPSGTGAPALSRALRTRVRGHPARWQA
jgi:hypothetical protein